MLFRFRGLAICYENSILKSQEDSIPTRTNAMAPFPLLFFKHLHSYRLSTMSGKPLNTDREQKHQPWSPRVALTVLDLIVFLGFTCKQLISLLQGFVPFGFTNHTLDYKKKKRLSSGVVLCLCYLCILRLFIFLSSPCFSSYRCLSFLGSLYTINHIYWWPEFLVSVLNINRLAS